MKSMQDICALGQLLSVNDLIVEVCKVGDYECSNCAGFNRKTLCKRLPDCGSDRYYRKLNDREIRKAKRENITITEI